MLKELAQKIPMFLHKKNNRQKNHNKEAINWFCSNRQIPSLVKLKALLKKELQKETTEEHEKALEKFNC